MAFLRWLFVDRGFILVFGLAYMIVTLILVVKTHNKADYNAVYENVGSKQLIIPKKLRHYQDKRVPKTFSLDILGMIKTKGSETAKDPYVNYTTCASLPKPAFLPRHALPLTALASFPGSGNTWLRMLLSSLTGVNTGDIYRDGAFSRTSGFTYATDDRVIAVKTHHPFWDERNGRDPSAPKDRYWERALVLVRHPLDATISAYNWFRMKGSHTKSASIDMFINNDGKPTKEWDKWAHDQIRNWSRMLHYWVNQFKGDILIVFYENLKANLEEELCVINDWLGIRFSEKRLSCTLQSTLQHKFRRKKSGIDKKIVYETSMLNEAEIVLRTAMNLLKTNYTHPTTFHIPDEYATNLLQENFSNKPP